MFHQPSNIAYHHQFIIIICKKTTAHIVLQHIRQGIVIWSILAIFVILLIFTSPSSSEAHPCLHLLPRYHNYQASTLMIFIIMIVLITISWAHHGIVWQHLSYHSHLCSSLASSSSSKSSPSSFSSTFINVSAWRSSPTAAHHQKGIPVTPCSHHPRLTLRLSGIISSHYPR